MSFLLAPIVTVNLFGGLDICWLALILLTVGLVGAGVWYDRAKKKDKPRRTLIGITAAIALGSLFVSCGVSALTDATAAVENTTEWIQLFGVHLPISRVAFTILVGDGFSVYWYGILIAVGFLLALGYAFRNAARFQIDTDRFMDCILVGMVGSILCARVYYLLFDGVPLSSFAEIFAIHDGGIAIYGAVIGALVFGGGMCWLRKVNVLDAFDMTVIGFSIGQAIGRWGNFVNQEVYGRETGSTWFGMTGSSIAYKYGEALVHPLFLYESLWCALIFVVLHRLSKRRKFSGQILCTYAMLYPAGRFFFEGARDTEYILKLGVGISVSQVVSVLAVLASMTLYLVLKRRNEGKTEGVYESQFGEFDTDPEAVADAYVLLGCEWDAEDSEVDAAYASVKEKFESMEAETDEQREKIENKLAEIDAAYAFLQKARAAEANVDSADSEGENNDGTLA